MKEPPGCYYRTSRGGPGEVQESHQVGAAAVPRSNRGRPDEPTWGARTAPEGLLLLDPVRVHFNGELRITVE